MSDWLEARLQDFLMFSVLLGSFVWLIAASKLIPPPYGEIAGQAGYFIIIFLGIFGIEVAVREYVNSYPYIRALIRPNNEWIHLFLMPPGTTRKIGSNQYATTLDLRFPITLPGYEKVKRIELHHTGPWAKRIKFRRGYATWNGFIIRHPQTEIIEVFQSEKSTTMLDHGEPVPIFLLHSASQDYYREHLAASSEADACLARNLEELKAQLAEAERQKLEWHQRAISAEEIIEQQKSEIRGLLEAKSNMKDLAYEYMLTIYQACHSIDKALAMLRGPRFAGWINKYVVALILGILAIAYVWYNPQFGSALYTWLSNPMNQLFVIAFAGIIALVIYYVSRRR